MKHGVKSRSYFLESDNSDVKCHVNFVVIQDDMVASFENISSWEKMKMVINLFLKFKKNTS